MQHPPFHPGNEKSFQGGPWPSHEIWFLKLQWPPECFDVEWYNTGTPQCFVSLLSFAASTPQRAIETNQRERGTGQKTSERPPPVCRAAVVTVLTTSTTTLNAPLAYTRVHKLLCTQIVGYMFNIQCSIAFGKVASFPHDTTLEYEFYKNRVSKWRVVLWWDIQTQFCSHPGPWSRSFGPHNFQDCLNT